MPTALLPLPAPVRGCDGCTLCCKVMAIRGLNKPADSWCQHCEIATGCTIYAERPAGCRTFNCRYLLDPALGEEWKPSVSKLVIVPGGDRVLVHVDHEHPEAWRREPYYSIIKQWSRHTAGLPVFLRIGRRLIAVYPSREVEMSSAGLWPE
jgi:hypothetical protein